VRLLLEHGADVEVKDNNGKTALQLRLTEDMTKSWNYCENMEPSRNTL
jgi:ankyrin repeat protein